MCSQAAPAVVVMGFVGLFRHSFGNDGYGEEDKKWKEASGKKVHFSVVLCDRCMDLSWKNITG